MNIVLIHTHDTGRHLRPYGAAVDTPNLQKLAEGGVLFRQAFCAAPQCSPSRASLMTGQWPHNHGLIGLTHRGFRLADPGRHFPHRLKEAGYHTALIGIQHESPPDRIEELGYQDCIGEVGRHSVGPAEAARKWITENAKQPFFLSLGFAETHRGFSPAESSDRPGYTAPLPWLPDRPEIREDVADLNTSVRHVDQGVGIVMATLYQLEIAKDTLLIFTTDHGLAIPKGKSTLYDAGIGVALVMRGPGGFNGGKVIDSIVSQIDLFPTVMELAERPVPDYVQGKSLLPLVRGETERLHEAIFSEQTFHAAEDQMRCVRTDRYKYIRFYQDGTRAILPNVDNSPTKTLQHDAGVLTKPRAKEIFFDLMYDPHEFHNLISDSDYEDVRKDLAGRLERWMRETEDPLLKGLVSLPDGARVTPRTKYDPRLPE